MSVQNVYLLEEDYQRLETSYNRGVGPRIVRVMWDYTQLVLGVLGLCISFLWWLQVILFVIVSPPATPFLNNMFIGESAVRFSASRSLIDGNVQHSIECLASLERRSTRCFPFTCSGVSSRETLNLACVCHFSLKFTQ